MSNRPKNGGYEVGYGKPPKHTRFKPGQSGNPKGRPKGCQNMRTELDDVLNEPVKVRENGKTRTLTLRQAAIRTTAHDAVKGDRHARGMLFKLINEYLPNEADVPVPPEVDRAERDAQRIKAYTAAMLWDEDLPDDFD